MRRRSTFTAIGIAACLTQMSVKAGEAPEAVQASPSPDPDRFSHLPKLLLEDAKEVLVSPERWKKQEWTQAGLGLAAILGTALVLDQPMDKAAARNARPSWDRAAKNVEFLGGTGSILIAGGAYLGGVAFENSEVRAVGIDACMTMAIAQLTLTLPLKSLAGRSRPCAEEGTHHFHPLSGGQSFPSGHATQAFALAAVVAEHADRPWVSGVSYGLATLVALSRVEQRQHFLSDVIAGGLIGTCVGKVVVHHNQRLREGKGSKVSWSLTPLLGPDMRGISLSARF